MVSLPEDNANGTGKSAITPASFYGKTSQNAPPLPNRPAVADTTKLGSSNTQVFMAPPSDGVREVVEEDEASLPALEAAPLPSFEDSNVWPTQAHVDPWVSWEPSSST